MQKYQSHKVVEAAQIVMHTDGLVVVRNADGTEENVTVPEDFAARGEPSNGDYLVRYQPDGYLSWSPRAAFEAGYTLIEDGDFPHTAETSRGWADTAAQHLRNEEYYRGLVSQIGAMFGDAAFTDDGGELHDSVLCAKVPELVREALAKRTRPIGGADGLLTP